MQMKTEFTIHMNLNAGQTQKLKLISMEKSLKEMQTDRLKRKSNMMKEKNLSPQKTQISKKHEK